MSITLTDKEIRYFQTKIRKWGNDNYQDYPWRQTDNIWHVIVAEIMLQRTRAEQVLPVYNDFVLRFNSPETFFSHLLESDENIFEKLGLKWRHQVFKKTVAHILEFGIPQTREEFAIIPGIGDYITSAVLSFHMGIREAIIDCNIIRLYGRFYGFRFNNETRRTKWFKILADSLTPARKFKEFNYGALDYSMKICSVKPNCSNCFISKRCKYNTYEALKNK